MQHGMQPCCIALQMLLCQPSGFLKRDEFFNTEASTPSESLDSFWDPGPVWRFLLSLTARLVDTCRERSSAENGGLEGMGVARIELA